MHKKHTTLLLLITAGLLAACTKQETAAPAQGHHALVTATAAAETLQNAPSAPALDPGKGQEIGFVYEAWLSPQQEPNEERNTPSMVPKELRSTAPSLDRNERKSRGHGVIRFARDLSKVYVDVGVEGVNAADVVMFHIHAGKPDQLGPILVDFAHMTDIPKNLADGLFSIVVTNQDIEKTATSGHGLIGALTAGVPIIPGQPDKVKTVAGMEHIARRGELYFNLHTKGQTFYGDIRGQLLPVAK